MLNPDEAWLAEYSTVQGAFHVETAREMMESNVRQILEGWTNSYLPFAVCSSVEEASQACDALRDVMLRHGGKMDGFGVQVWMPSEAQPEQPAEVAP